jgi:hypothetical protein
MSMSIAEIQASSRQNEANRAAYTASNNFPKADTSLKWYEGDSLSSSEWKTRISGNTIRVTIGRNELPALMEEIERALANGESYLTAIEKFYDNKNHYVGGSVYDTIYIDPFTGTVKHAAPVGFAYSGEGKVLHSMQDDDAVWDLAYNLQTFPKLRVFGETGGLSVSEVERVLDEIRESQANKCTWRFGMEAGS